MAVSLACEPALFIGGFWGLWGLRRSWGRLAPLGLFLLGTMAIHVISVSQMRYRLAVMPILILAAAEAAATKAVDAADLDLFPHTKAVARADAHAKTVAEASDHYIAVAKTAALEKIKAEMRMRSITVRHKTGIRTRKTF